MSDTQTVTLAHLSDVHLAPVAGFEPRYWTMKRTMGWLNWQRKRRFVHTQPALDAIVADIKSQAPDHVLVSGDLINIGLPAEYAAARTWLQSLGSPDRVSLVPGNHDAYVAQEARAGLSAWAPYMTSDAYGRSLGISAEQNLDAAFPYVRRIGRVAIVGVNSGVATRPGSAEGYVGPAQLARLSARLETLGQAGLLRVIMIHHPPVPGLATAGRALRDAAALAAILAHSGAELVVHGHNHTLTQTMHAGSAILGVGSASAARRLGCEPLACYHLIRVADRGDHTRIEIETRGIAAPGGPVASLALRALPPHDAESPVSR